MASPTIVDAAQRVTKVAKRNWVKGAVDPKNKGKFAAEAAAAGKSTAEFAAEKADAPGALGKEARLAKTFEKIRPKGKLHYPNSK